MTDIQPDRGAIFRARLAKRADRPFIAESTLAGGKRQPGSAVRRAMRLKCLDCAEDRAEIAACEFDGKREELCPLWRFRLGHTARVGRGSLLRPIRAFCLYFCSGQWSEVKACPVTTCPLYTYRFGKRPKEAARATQGG